MEKKLECPSCGRMSMVRKKGPAKMADGVQIKNIQRWVCEHCGEELFDLKAMKEIRAQRAHHSIAA
jgi:transposase-like protein